VRPAREVPLLSPEDVELRDRLIREEADEYKGAAIEGDLVEVADGLADLLYVVLGTCVAHGIDIQPIFDEVHRSNMTKDTLDPVTRKGGKGPNYERPRVAEFLLMQTTGLT
jgi:predicted HAD superfamily Cof-like phosphohydrolase